MQKFIRVKYVVFFLAFLLVSALHAQQRTDFMMIKVTQKIIDPKNDYFNNGKIVPDGLLNMRTDNPTNEFNLPPMTPPLNTSPNTIRQLDSLLDEQTNDIFAESLNNLLEKEENKEEKIDKNSQKNKKGVGKLFDKLKKGGKKGNQTDENAIEDERNTKSKSDKFNVDTKKIENSESTEKTSGGGIGGGVHLDTHSNEKTNQDTENSQKTNNEPPIDSEEAEVDSIAPEEEQMDMEGDTALFFNNLDDFEIEEQAISFRVPKSLIREDTTNLFDVKFESIVTIDEQLAYDDQWVTIASYFAIWDSDNINPYDEDINELQDSVAIKLYDPEKQQMWANPLASIEVTSRFGYRWRRWHHGVDLDLNVGDPIMATFDGIVRISKYDRRGGYGNVIVLRHYNGLETVYGHMSKLGVNVGQPVKAGTEIGKGGSTGRSTGPHLHYEVRYKGHTFDPEYIYDFDSARIKTDLFLLKPQHFEHLSQRRQIIYHTVQEGETLNKISLMYRISVRHLCALNRISSRTLLRIGRKLRVR